MNRSELLKIRAETVDLDKVDANILRKVIDDYVGEINAAEIELMCQYINHSQLFQDNEGTNLLISISIMLFIVNLFSFKIMAGICGLLLLCIGVFLRTSDEEKIKTYEKSKDDMLKCFNELKYKENIK